jgi:hypothetical protein
MGDGRDFWRSYSYEVPDGPRDAVDRPVLARALGASLAVDEDVICARFVWSAKGRLLGSATTGSGTHVIVVTDRRIMRVTAWSRGEALDGSPREALGVDEMGSTGFITRHSLWLGELRTAEAGTSWLTDQRLSMRTADGRKETVIARAETILALDAAVRQALEGKGRWTVPPPASATPQPIGGWVERIAAVLRPNPRPPA